MKGKLYGVGVDDLNYKYKIRDKSGKVLWFCPFYSKWRDMIRRCYSEKELLRKPTYRHVTVCEDWLIFSKFKLWMESMDWEGNTLDKDLFSGKIYSPSTCVWIHAKVNTFLCGESRLDNRSGYTGVCWQKDAAKWRAQCKNPNGTTSYSRRGYIGLFSCPKEAHEAWRKMKHKYAIELADSSLVTDHRVRDALKSRYEYHNWYNSK